MNHPAQLDAVSQESLLAEIADEFIERINRGEQPDIDEYAEQHPQLAEVLRQILPALELMRFPPADPDPATDSQHKTQATGRLGDYRILREIGRGGMGVVYEAEQVSLGRKVALKVLPFAAMLDKRQLQRFRNEARAAASLKHPNIVQVYAVACERAVHFYAMEYIEGQTLAEVISHLRQREELEDNAPEEGSPDVPNPADSLASGRFAPPKGSSERNALTAAYTENDTPGAMAETRRTAEAALSTEQSTKSLTYFRSVAEIGVQVAEALDHAHEHGIIHRDVKPSNVILDNQGKPWVTDFGLARIETDGTLTVSGDLLGTVRYMSPEQALAKRIVVDHRTDVYSLGVTLYELLTLQPVFNGQDRQELLRQIAFEEPKKPRRLNKSIPEELEIIVLKAMAKNPAERYDTAQELANDLKRFLEDRPIRARRPTLVQLAAKWSRRHKAIVWSAVVSVFVLLAVGLVGLGVGNQLLAQEKARTEDALSQSRKAEREGARQRKIAQARRREAEKERHRAEENYRTAREAVDRLFTRVAERLQGEPHMEQIRRELLEDALEFYRGFLKQRSDNPELKMETALAYRRVGEIQGLLGDWEKSLVSHQASAKILKELHRRSPDNIDYRADLARSHDYLADALTRLARFQEAESQIETAIPMWEELVKSHPKVPEYLEDFIRLCRTGQRTAFCQYKPAQEYAARSGEMLRRLHKDFPDYAADERLLTVSYGNRLSQVKDIELLMKSEQEIRERIKALQEQVESHPDVPQYQADLCGALANFGHILLAMDRFKELEHLVPKVIALREKLVEENPEILEYHIQLGWARYQYGLLLHYLGRESEAAEHFRIGIGILSKVVESNPDNLRPNVHLVGMLVGCPASQFREPERALQLATRNLQLGGNDWAQLTIAQIRAGEYKEALASCKKAAGANRDQSQLASVYEAVAQWHVGNQQQARRKFVQATNTIEEDPGQNRWRHHLEYRLFRREVEELMGIRPNAGDWTLWWARGAGCLKVREWSKAIENFDQAIELNPDHAMLYVQRSIAYRRNGDHAKAIDDCTAALGIDPESSAAYHHRAAAYRASGHYEKAIEDATAGLKIAPKNDALLEERALNYNHLGVYDKAIADFSEVLRLSSDRSDAYRFRAEAYLALGRYEEALADCDKYVELRPNETKRQLIRAEMLLMAGRTAQYRQKCKEMLDRLSRSEEASAGYYAARASVLAPKTLSDPVVPITLAKEAVAWDSWGWNVYTLGMAHLRAGQLDEAVRRFQKSLDAHPDWHNGFLAWLGLALVHCERGEPEEARKWLSKAVKSMEQSMEQHPIEPLHARLEAQLLRREVEERLGKLEKEEEANEGKQEE